MFLCFASLFNCKCQRYGKLDTLELNRVVRVGVSSISLAAAVLAAFCSRGNSPQTQLLLGGLPPTPLLLGDSLPNIPTIGGSPPKPPNYWGVPPQTPLLYETTNYITPKNPIWELCRKKGPGREEVIAWLAKSPGQQIPSCDNDSRGLA